ncbi:MAG: SMC-Scp complex subunit ScpB [Terracidiphilus sp.]|jgi:segregation and condensation protein B
MSLKAKLEAVIYAAEEPVTLAQLAALFTEEALEWKAEQEAAAAAKAEEPAATEDAGLPELNAAFPYLELEPVAVGEAAAEAVETGAEADGGSAGVDARTTAGQEAGGTEPAAAEEAVAGDEAEAKRAMRLREREARNAIGQLLDELTAEYANDERGIEIREIAGGYRMATKPQCHDAVRAFVKRLKPPLKLSLPALETLAVIAYKQPVTAPEVNEIRGVDSSGVFGSLLARKLIVTAGRKPVVGRPILYKTTREFLLRFGLKDVTELPSMEEFEKMAASELDEAALEAGDDTAQEAAAEFNADMSAELEEAADEEPAETKENAPEAAPSGNE